MDEQERDEGFKVRDKRRFTSDGENRPETEADTEKPEPSKAETVHDSGEFEDEASAPPPPLDFASFVLSLANTALFQLGLVKMPDQDEPMKDLEGARQTIDLLALMEEKTKGNLTEQEEKIMTEALYQLRMAFVEASKSG